MMTVNQVSRRTGVSVRTLQYYDRIGLLHPAGYSDAGYRLYNSDVLEKLEQILLFKELEFPLREIREILESPDFDGDRALEQQITLLEMKKERLENLISLARTIRTRGVKAMDFQAFDTKKLDEYAKRAKASWGGTKEYRAFEEKDRNRTGEEKKTIAAGLMAVFEEFGKIRDQAPDSGQAQALVKKLQGYISEHYYPCSDETLQGLGKMYGCGGEFTENINRAAGEGTAEFASAAIEAAFRK